MTQIQIAPEVAIYASMAETLSSWDLVDARNISGPRDNWFHLAALCGVSALVSALGGEHQHLGGGGNDSPLTATPVSAIAMAITQDTGVPRLFASAMITRILTDVLAVPVLNDAFFSLPDERKCTWAMDWARCARDGFHADVYRDLIGCPVRAAGELARGFELFWSHLSRLLDEDLNTEDQGRPRLGSFPLTGAPVNQTIRLPSRSTMLTPVSAVGPLPKFPYMHRLRELHIVTGMPAYAATNIEEVAAGEIWRHRGETVELAAAAATLAIDHPNGAGPLAHAGQERLADPESEPPQRDGNRIKQHPPPVGPETAHTSTAEFRNRRVVPSVAQAANQSPTRRTIGTRS